MFITKQKKKELDDKIAALTLEVKDLKDIVKTQELIKLRAENSRLKEIENLIGKVRFKLKNVAYIPEENFILVKYEVPSVTVPVSEDGKVLMNEMFYAINKLQLLSLNDLKKISAVVNEINGTK